MMASPWGLSAVPCLASRIAILMMPPRTVGASTLGTPASGVCGASPEKRGGTALLAAVGAGPTLDRMTARASEAAPRDRPVPVPRVAPSARGATLAAALTCAAAVGFGVYAEEGRRALGRSWDLALLDLIAGLVFVGAGAAVFLWRPANRCWWLLVASGATWFLGTLAGVGDDDLATVGFVTVSWHYYFLAHLLLAFPTGRLPARRDVVLLAAIAAVLTVKSLVRLLLYVPPDGTGCQCAQNRFTGVDDGRWYDLAEAAFPWVISVLFALVVAEVVVRWARSSGAGRRMLTPVLIMSAAVAAQIAYSQVIRQELAWAVVRSQDLFVLVVGLRAIAAYSIVVGLRRTGQARAAVAGAVSELDADPARLTRRAAERPGGSQPRGAARVVRRGAVSPSRARRDRDRGGPRPARGTGPRRGPAGGPRADLGRRPRPSDSRPTTKGCAASSRNASTSWPLPGSASSRPRTPSGGGSSATCTTAPSSG